MQVARKCCFLLTAGKAGCEPETVVAHLINPGTWGFSFLSQCFGVQSLLFCTHTFIHPPIRSLIHQSLPPSSPRSLLPSLSLSSYVHKWYDGLDIVLDTENTKLALLRFSHELLQTPVLLQSFYHLLGSHWPNGVLLQAVREEQSLSAKLVTATPRPRTPIQGERSELSTISTSQPGRRVPRKGFQMAAT